MARHPLHRSSVLGHRPRAVPWPLQHARQQLQRGEATAPTRWRPSQILRRQEPTPVFLSRTWRSGPGQKESQHVSECWLPAATPGRLQRRSRPVAPGRKRRARRLVLEARSTGAQRQSDLLQLPTAEDTADHGHLQCCYSRLLRQRTLTRRRLGRDHTLQPNVSALHPLCLTHSHDPCCLHFPAMPELQPNVPLPQLHAMRWPRLNPLP
mmetsp:Transcript_55450/g.140543  ORF Transcript_55450/g.140543 Transcript_55450/m.140543 type:complete len:209 (-) Transcript_55450:659-1285(-)